MVMSTAMAARKPVSQQLQFMEAAFNLGGGPPQL